MVLLESGAMPKERHKGPEALQVNMLAEQVKSRAEVRFSQVSKSKNRQGRLLSELFLPRFRRH